MSKITRLWKSLSVSLLSAGLVGCQGGKSASAPPLVSKTPVEVSPIDENTRADDIFLLSGNSRIVVGDNSNDALTGAFKKPDRAVTATRVPPGLDDTFRFTGWESTGRSVGLISRNRTVLLAMETRENISQDQRDQVITTYRKLFGLADKEVQRPHAHYYFWERGKARFMVCTTVDSRGTVSMTSAVGVVPLMTKFRMDAESAEKDSSEAELRLNRTTAS